MENPGLRPKLISFMLELWLLIFAQLILESGNITTIYVRELKIIKRVSITEENDCLSVSFCLRVIIYSIKVA